MGIIGLPITRRDGRGKVTGAAKYAAEFHQPDMAYAVLVQSTISHGDIDTIDTREALAIPGVLAVITPDNALRLDVRDHVPQTIKAPLLQDRSVPYNGSHVAVVVADSFERARQAAAAVRVTYATAPAVTTMDSALDRPVMPKNFRNGARSPDSFRGDPEAAYAAAPVKVRQTYTTPIEHHNPMELHATVARWDDGRLTVWHTTQGVVGAAKTLAGLFGLPQSDVRVIDPYVGGGFGSKGNAWPPMTLAAMAAKMVGRPVRLELTRAQMFTSNGYRPPTVQVVQLGAERDGTLVSLRHNGSSQNSRDPKLGEYSEPFALASELLYRVDNAAVSHRLIAVNQGLPTYMRAPGEAPGVYALECAMDELAVALDMDPLELRLKNYTDVDQHEDKPFSSKRLRECYAQAASAFGWSRRQPAPRSMRDGRWLVGWGMATSTYPANRSKASARVTVTADGVLVQSATQDIGTGTYTVLAQIAADRLGVPVSRVRVEIADSHLPEAPVSGGSQTLASVGPAVQAAADAAREKVFAAAQRRWQGLSAAELRFDGLVVSGPAGRMSMAELLAHDGADSVVGDASTESGDGKKTHSLHSFGAHFAEIRVDEDTGEIRVARWVGAFDAGRIINAKTARSQAIGGITYGIGMALLEQTQVDAKFGRYTNRTLAEYLMPVNADIPDLQTILLDSDDPVISSLGARGLGELPMVGVAPAVANAVYHATGRRIRDLPIRPEHLLA